MGEGQARVCWVRVGVRYVLSVLLAKGEAKDEETRGSGQAGPRACQGGRRLGRGSSIISHRQRASARPSSQPPLAPSPPPSVSVPPPDATSPRSGATAGRFSALPA